MGTHRVEKSIERKYGFERGKPRDGDSDLLSVDKQKRGHKGIITLKENDKIEAHPTTETTYTAPNLDLPASKGPRLKLKEKFYWKTAVEEAKKEVETNDKDETPLTSEYRDNINVDDFRSVKPKPVFDHKLYGENPVSYWTEKVKTTGIHGVTQLKTKDTPFRKNTAFSKPIAESVDQPKPFEYEDYPNM